MKRKNPFMTFQSPATHMPKLIKIRMQKTKRSLLLMPKLKVQIKKLPMVMKKKSLILKMHQLSLKLMQLKMLLKKLKQQLQLPQRRLL